MKIDTLYLACSPELDLVSYGGCQDEAVNNLADDVRTLEWEAREGNHAQ